jgi:hypothetical protein
MASTEKVQVDIIATDKASGPIKKVRGEIDKVAESAKVTAKQTRNLGGAMGGVGRGAGQAGIQVQQFVGQVQAGTPFLLAFSQQSTDLGFVLGFPLLGAVAGITASLAGPFIQALMGASVEMTKMRDSVDKMFTSFDKMTPAVKQFVVLDLKREASEAASALAKAQQALNEASNTSRTSAQQITELTAARDLEQAKLGVVVEKIGLATGVLNVHQESITEVITKLSDEVLLYGKSAEQILAYQLATQGATEEEIKLAVGLQETLNSLKEAEKATKALAAARDLAEKKAKRDALERMKLISNSMSAEHKFMMESQRLQKILQGPDGVFDSTEIEAYRVAIEDVAAKLFKAGQATDEMSEADRKLKEDMEALNGAFKKIGEDGLKRIEDSFVNLINGSKSVKDSFKDMARSIIDDLIRMQVRASITGPLQSALTGLFGGAPSAPIPVTDLSSPAGSLPSFAGGGYTGMSRRSGGVDGKGGFPAILHPNETVVDHTRGQGMGGVNVTLNISTGVSQTVRAEIANLLPQITAATKAAVADARQRGGGYSKSLVGA